MKIIIIDKTVMALIKVGRKTEIRRVITDIYDKKAERYQVGETVIAQDKHRTQSSIKLKILSVDIANLNDMSETDAQREGIPSAVDNKVSAFKSIWNKISPLKNKWEKNQRVLIYKFKVIV